MVVLATPTLPVLHSAAMLSTDIIISLSILNTLDNTDNGNTYRYSMFTSILKIPHGDILLYDTDIFVIDPNDNRAERFIRTDAIFFHDTDKFTFNMSEWLRDIGRMILYVDK